MSSDTFSCGKPIPISLGNSFLRQTAPIANANKKKVYTLCSALIFDRQRWKKDGNGSYFHKKDPITTTTGWYPRRIIIISDLNGLVRVIIVQDNRRREWHWQDLIGREEEEETEQQHFFLPEMSPPARNGTFLRSHHAIPIPLNVVRLFIVSENLSLPIGKMRNRWGSIPTTALNFKFEWKPVDMQASSWGSLVSSLRNGRNSKRGMNAE